MGTFENWPQKYSQKVEYWLQQRNNFNISQRACEADKIARLVRESTGVSFEKYDCSNLESDGVQILDNLVTKEQASEMYEYFYNTDCYDFYNNHQKFKIKNVPNYVKLGRHTILDNLRCPHMLELITNDKVINLASSFLGSPATLTNLLPMWSFKSHHDEPINMQLFHRDAEDYKFIKIFIFLSDVQKGNGEQVYIKGTSNMKNLPIELYKIERYPNQLINRHLDLKKHLALTGSAGFSWAANPYGIHRGTVPSDTHRLLLQLQFSYEPVPIFNYKSYQYSKWEQLSELAKYTNRLYLKEQK